MAIDVLCLEQIKKDFGKTEVLKNINFVIEKGSVYGLVGQNGAGKTTLLRLITGLMKPTEGNISLHTETPYIGYMPQSCRFDDRQTVAGTVSFFSALRKKENVEGLKLCKKLELDTAKKVKHLSPGQQKKLQMVIAMIGDPDLYILDEPTAGLDPGATYEMGKLLKEIRNNGKSMVISSHILQDMDIVCTNVVIMESGKLIYNQELESSYIVKTSPIEEALLERLTAQFELSASDDRMIVHVKTDQNGVAELIKMLTFNAVDIFEVSLSKVKNVIHQQLRMGEKEGQ
ncbi:ABC transporter ATP-binding protein [Acetobacterium woodii]|uniref:ABC transporter ATP-binding protein n=1 Tax=Acetobacterium woodii TaxID=33952 RepID=UPI0002F38C86|nr:ABC transporter ATP-binding protein [Acetobacterium woodii]